MEKIKYDELKNRLHNLISKRILDGKKIIIFGHCNDTEELVDLLLIEGYEIEAILDNNAAKHGLKYRNVPIVSPTIIRKNNNNNYVVLIASRFYEAMNSQLMDMGFEGSVYKLVDYNSYAEYSLSNDTISEKKIRLSRGKTIIETLEKKYPETVRIFCPYSSLGDIYYCMSYLFTFLKKRKTNRAVVCVYKKSCKEVVSIFGGCEIELLTQSDLEAAVQATLFLHDEFGFIAHNDKPYVMNLTKALLIKKIPFEIIYKSGVFGLPLAAKPAIPISWDTYPNMGSIPEGKSVILAPYAGSVISIGDEIWLNIRDKYKNMGYKVFTNIAPGEKPIKDTEGIFIKIREIKSVVERAGTFIGLRSGLCDVIRSTKCRKIALYPDYNFSGTKWKAIDIFALDEFENIVIKEGSEWKTV